MACNNAFHVRSAKLRHDDKVAGRWPVNGGEPCVFCDLPIGIPCDPEPANDTPDALVELRAAELAVTASKSDPTCSGELYGWMAAEGTALDDVGGDGETSAVMAGWLGFVIYMHEEQL